eukprot:s209_g8.t10
MAPGIAELLRGCRDAPAAERARGEDPAPSDALLTWVTLRVPYHWPSSEDLPTARRHLDHFLEALSRPSAAWPGVASEAVVAAAAPLRASQEGEDVQSADADKAWRLCCAARRALRPLLAATLAPQLRKFEVALAKLVQEAREKLFGFEQQLCPSVDLQVNTESPPGRLVLDLRGELPAGIEGKLPLRHEIHAEHAEKLKRLFAKEETSDDFNTKCWVLLTRHRALFGPHDEGAGWHMALTSEVFECLQDTFGVQHELFASPLNCTLPSYCSLFPDTDRGFGSKGGFFRFCEDTLVRGGSFECNPPFEEGLLARAVAALLRALAAEGPALSVVLVLPAWPGSAAIEMVCSSHFVRASAEVSGEDHCYLNGRQHSCQKRHRLLRQTEARGSLVAVLQNAAAAEACPDVEAKLAIVRSAWGDPERKMRRKEGRESKRPKRACCGWGSGSEWFRRAELQTLSAGAWYAIHWFGSGWESTRVNFQDASSTVPDDYLPDTGRLYPGLFQLTGYRYGWRCPFVGGFNRRYFDDPVLDTGMALACEDSRWEMDVVVGRFYVRVQYGDPGQGGETEGCRLEDVSADAGSYDTFSTPDKELRVPVFDARVTFNGSAQSGCSSVSDTPQPYVYANASSHGTRHGFEGSDPAEGLTHCLVAAPCVVSRLLFHPDARVDLRRSEAQLQAAGEGDEAVKIWSPGPAKLKSSSAKRALKNLQYDPLLVLFDDTVKEEFRILAALKQQQEQSEAGRHGELPGALSEAFGLASLRRRILQVKRQELFRTAAELLYLMVASMFKYLEVPLMPPLIGGGMVKLDMSGEQLKGLTEIYSMEAILDSVAVGLEMVRDHLFKIIDVQAPDRGANAPALRISLYQASQVYAMSALFGYFLRQADIRYQLDKLVSLGSKDAPPEPSQHEGRKKHRRPVPRWMELQWVQSETQSDVSLKDYIERFGPAELRQIRSPGTVASAEARYTLEIQIGALFGNLRDLKSRLMKAIEGARNDEEATELLQEAVMSGKIQSISALEIYSLPRPNRMWRLRSLEAPPERWAVQELALHEDSDCFDTGVSETIQHDLFSSGYQDGHPPSLAFDGSLETSWRDACLACPGGLSWLALSLVSSVRIRCIRLFQDASFSRLASAVVLESWNSSDWIVESTFADLQGGAWGKYNLRWESPAAQNRWRFVLATPNISLAVAELAFFADLGCSQPIAGIPIASATRIGAAAYDAFDGDDATSWVSECRECAVGEAWIGLHLDVASDVACTSLLLASAPARLLQGLSGLAPGIPALGDPIELDLELWNSTSWVSASSSVALRVGARGASPRLAAEAVAPSRAWRIVTAAGTGQCSLPSHLAFMDVAGRQKQHAEFLFIRDKKLIRVFAASGFEMASIPSDVLTDVRSLKKQLHGICGFPRFRQRLLYNASILQDQTKLDSEMDLQLVTLPFAPVPMVDQMKPYLATDSGDLDQLEEFLQRPIDPNLHTFGDQGGLTLLLYAAYKGGLEAAEMLLEAGADPNLPGGPNKDTPLGVACCAGDVKMIRLLMNAGADSDQAQLLLAGALRSCAETAADCATGVMHSQGGSVADAIGEADSVCALSIRDASQERQIPEFWMQLVIIPWVCLWMFSSSVLGMARFARFQYQIFRISIDTLLLMFLSVAIQVEDWFTLTTQYVQCCMSKAVRKRYRLERDLRRAQTFPDYQKDDSCGRLCRRPSTGRLSKGCSFLEHLGVLKQELEKALAADTSSKQDLSLIEPLLVDQPGGVEWSRVPNSEEYLKKLCHCLEAMCDKRMAAGEAFGASELRLADWLVDRQKAIGRTALCLSGGGSLAMYHMGVCRFLLEAG